MEWSGATVLFLLSLSGCLFRSCWDLASIEAQQSSYDPRQGRSGQYRYQRNLSANYWRVPASFILSVSLRGKGKLSGCVRVLPLSCLHLGFYRNRKLEIQGGQKLCTSFVHHKSELHFVIIPWKILCNLCEFQICHVLVRL